MTKQDPERITIESTGEIFLEEFGLQPEVYAMLLKCKEQNISIKKTINNLLFDTLVERLGKTYRLKTLDSFEK